MDPSQFFAASRVVIVAGKGGVGKTTVSAALGRAAARAGLATLIIDVEGKSGLPSMFGQPKLTYDEALLSPGGGPDGAADLRARTLTADDALLEYLEDHSLRRLSKRLVSSGAIDVVATAAPGIKDILLLGKIKQLERAPDTADLIVLDAPAAGHAISFLQSARGLLDAVRVGPIHTQAAEVLEMLTDPARCQVMLVTLPEETPVNELTDTAYALEDRVGVSLAPVVVNGVYPDLGGLDSDPAACAEASGIKLKRGEANDLRAAADFRRHRQALQQDQIRRLAADLPLPQLTLPYFFESDLGPVEIEQLADELLTGIGGIDAAQLGRGNVTDAEGPEPIATGGAAS